MSFTTSKMLNHRVLVSGEDINGVSGQTVVSSTEWDDIKAHRSYHTAEADFDAAVAEFFAPITAAAEALNKTVAQPTVDSIDYVVIHEGTEAVAGEKPVIAKLSKDSIILRLIESGDTARLVWVNDELEILEVAVNVPTP